MNNIEDRELDMIRKDSENIQIPEGLLPDNMMKKIAMKKAEGYFDKKEDKKVKSKKKRNKKFIALVSGGMVTVVAAASLGIILLGGVSKLNNEGGIRYTEYNSIYSNIAANQFSGENADTLSSYEDLARYYLSQNTMRKKKTASDKLKEWYSKLVYGYYYEDIYFNDIKGELNFGVVEDGIGANNDISLRPEIDSEEIETAPEGGDSTPDYSDTNTRTENVAEADIVKTDGEYIYSLNCNVDYRAYDVWELTLSVIKAAGANTEKLCEISMNEYLKNVVNWELSLDQGNYEMMLYENKLVVVCSNEGYTVLIFFDISDKSDIKHENTLFIEGSYDSCRLVDGYLYVFAEKSMYDIIRIYDQKFDILKENAVKNIIPCTSSGDVPAEDVYVSNCEDFNVYHMIGTVDMKNTSDFKQVKAVLGSDSGTIYVNANHIYYISAKNNSYANYNDGELVDTSYKSELIRLSYQEGMIEEKGKTVIDGIVGDEFAIDEYNGYLRMAVSVSYYKGTCEEVDVEYYNGEEWVDDKFKTVNVYTSNRYKRVSALYVLDEELNIVGSIPELQQEEEVYGVRFDGDIAYVVTYRNTDPLFTIDLSDPTNPTVLGALKIPGFSTYLHKWDDNKLIGIGYDDMRQIKISTFDITDKTDVKETDVCIVNGVFYSDALYNHKAIFVSADHNLLGFYGGDGVYRVFSYVDGVLTEVISQSLDYYSDARGLYIDEYIYIVGENHGIYVYTMSDYEKVAEIN